MQDKTQRQGEEKDLARRRRGAEKASNRPSSKALRLRATVAGSSLLVVPGELWNHDGVERGRRRSILKALADSSSRL